MAGKVKTTSIQEKIETHVRVMQKMSMLCSWNRPIWYFPYAAVVNPDLSEFSHGD